MNFFVLDRHPVTYFALENILRDSHNLEFLTYIMQWNCSSLKTYRKQHLILKKMQLLEHMGFGTFGFHIKIWEDVKNRTVILSFLENVSKSIPRSHNEMQ